MSSTALSPARADASEVPVTDGLHLVVDALRRNRVGEKIASHEIEVVLLASPDVLDAVSFGVPDPQGHARLRAPSRPRRGGGACDLSPEA